MRKDFSLNVDINADDIAKIFEYYHRNDLIRVQNEKVDILVTANKLKDFVENALKNEKITNLVCISKITESDLTKILTCTQIIIYPVGTVVLYHNMYN